MGAGNVAVTAVSNLVYDVEFRDALGQFDQAQMTATLVNAAGATVAMSTPRGGAVGAGVNVTYGATVELAGGLTIARETITLNGIGVASLGAIPLRMLAGAGTSTWQGNVILGSNPTGIDVATGSELRVEGNVSGNGFNKYGGGTLELNGTAANTMTQPNIVWQGGLELNKPVGVNALATGLTIGDYVGSAGSAFATLLQSDQILATQAVTVQGEGVFDMGGFSDTIASLTLNIGPNASPVVNSGAGTLTVNGNITVGVINGGRATGATINGNLALGGGAARTITVNDSNAVEDLILNAVLSDAAAGWTKAGAGRLVLPATIANTYTGATTVGAGELVIRNAASLGTSAAGTTVNSTGNGTLNASGSLIIDGDFTIVGETLRLNTANATDGNQALRNGTGFQGQGVLRVLSGSTAVWQGDVTLGTNSTANNAPRVTINVESGADLIIDGVIDQTGVSTNRLGVGLNKVGAGALEFAGTAANTYALPDGTGASAVTSVQNGILRLNKTAGVAAVQGRLEVGDNNGAAGTAKVVWLANDQFADQSGRQQRPARRGDGRSARPQWLLAKPSSALAPTRFYLRMGPTMSGALDLNGGTLTLGDGITNDRGNIGVLSPTPSSTIPPPRGSWTPRAPAGSWSRASAPTSTARGKSPTPSGPRSWKSPPTWPSPARAGSARPAAA